MTKIPKDFSCGVIVVRKEGEKMLYLIIKSESGFWGYPKGHQDPGETEKETALRELLEETGVSNIKLEGKSFLCNYQIFRKGQMWDKDVALFIGFTDDVEVNIPENFKHEIAATKWATFEEAKELFHTAFNKDALVEVLTEANEYLSKKF